MCCFTVMKSIVKDWCSQGESTWNQRSILYMFVVKICCVQKYVLYIQVFNWICGVNLPSNNSEVTIWADLPFDMKELLPCQQDLVPEFFIQPNRWMYCMKISTVCGPNPNSTNSTVVVPTGMVSPLKTCVGVHPTWEDPMGLNLTDTFSTWLWNHHLLVETRTYCWSLTPKPFLLSENQSLQFSYCQDSMSIHLV